MNQTLQLLKKPTVIVKLLELLLCSFCVGITAREFLVPDMVKLEVLHGTFLGFLLLDLVVLLGYAYRRPLHRNLVLCISCAGAAMFLASGGLLLNTYVNHKFKKALAAGILAVINCGVYIVDIGLTYCMSE